MTDTIRTQFLLAGLQLYPIKGYRKLSVAEICERADCPQEKFWEIFGNKKAYTADLLAYHFEQVFGRVNVDFSRADADQEYLRCILWRIALCVRNDTLWTNRLLADSQEGVKVVGQYFIDFYERLSDGLVYLLEKCDKEDRYTLEEQRHRFDYLTGAVFSPMILSMRLDDLGVLPARVSSHLPDMLTDAAIKQRIDWTLAALFPEVKAVPPFAAACG